MLFKAVVIHQFYGLNIVLGLAPASFDMNMYRLMVARVEHETEVEYLEDSWLGQSLSIHGEGDFALYYLIGGAVAVDGLADPVVLVVVLIDVAVLPIEVFVVVK